MITIITIYILTLVAMWFICLYELRAEREKVTIGDVVSELDWSMFVPIVNTITLLAAIFCWLVWDVCKLRKVWNKIKDKEL